MIASCYGSTAMRSEPTVYVVDDDAEVCRSLRRLIESAGFRVATYASAKEFLKRYDAKAPGCLVLDVRLPAYSGLNLRQQFVSEDVGLPVIILTGRGDESRPAPAARTGSSGVSQRTSDDQLLLDRVRRAVEWDIRNRRARIERAGTVARLALLTPREREVLDCVIFGRANKQIAKELGISIRTVESHRSHMMEKMRAESLPELVQLVQSANVSGHSGPESVPRP